MQNKSIALLVLLILVIPAAAWAQVYTWTDSSGTRHYSDAPPANGVKYSQLNVKSSAPENASKHASSSPSSSDTNGDQGASDAAKSNATSYKKSYCANVSGNISKLESKQIVTSTDSSGKAYIMSKQQRAQKLKLAQSRYRKYCKP